MIVDGHVHIFPFLGGSSGFDSESTHMRYLQRVSADAPAQIGRKSGDSSTVRGQERALWNPDRSGPEGALEVNFRVSKYGALQWTKDETDYQLQQFAPGFQEMTASPEYMISEMDYAGVDVAVLQNNFLYGQLNQYFSTAVRQYPSRFIGQVQLIETKAHQQSQINELKEAVETLRLSGGIYFSDRRYWENHFQDHIDDEKYQPLWEEVKSLGIPVFWCVSALKYPGAPAKSMRERYMDQLRRLDRWTAIHPGIACVIVHGLQLPPFTREDGRVDVPDEVWDVVRKPNVYLEVLFPIQVTWPRPATRQWDYPYREVQPLIRDLYRIVGPEKLVWGSDMPNVGRVCTYRQSLDYLVRYCDFISPAHMDMIVGGNATQLLGIQNRD